MKVGHTIVAARKARGWSREKLAGEVGLNYFTLQRIEAGRRLPRVEHLVAIAELLGLSLDDLLSVTAQSDAEGDITETQRGLSAFATAS